MIAGVHEQLGPYEVHDDELDVLLSSVKAAGIAFDLVRPRDGLGAAANRRALTPVQIWRCRKTWVSDLECAYEAVSKPRCTV